MINYLCGHFNMKHSNQLLVSSSITNIHIQKFLFFVSYVSYEYKNKLFLIILSFTNQLLSTKSQSPMNDQSMSKS